MPILDKKISELNPTTSITDLYVAGQYGSSNYKLNLGTTFALYISKSDTGPQSVAGDFTIGGDLGVADSIQTDVTLKSLYLGENITLNPSGTAVESNNYAIGKDIDFEGGNNYAFGSALTKDENTSGSILIGHSASMEGASGVFVANSSYSEDSYGTHLFGSGLASVGNDGGALIGLNLSVNGIEDIVVIGKDIAQITVGNAFNVHIGTDAVGESTQIHGETVNVLGNFTGSSLDFSGSGELGVCKSMSWPASSSFAAWGHK